MQVILSLGFSLTYSFLIFLLGNLSLYFKAFPIHAYLLISSISYTQKQQAEIILSYYNATRFHGLVLIIYIFSHFFSLLSLISGRISNLHKVIDDKYLVGSSFMRNIEEIGNLGNALNSMEELFGQYVIVIENLEEELSSANIAGFIREKIHISPEVYIYQSLLLKSYTWAVVMGNDKEELKQLRDFLCDPNQIIISSRGRYMFAAPLSYLCITILLFLILEGF